MRLEQIDSYLTEFESRVLAAEQGEGGWVRLERSAFYPTSGGQPHDTGTLRGDFGTARVVEVALRGPKGAAAEVWHRLEAGARLPRPGEMVQGEIDWERRYRNMQRHSAQHLLSQAFLRVDAAFATRSVGIASPDATLDLAGDPDDAALAAAERIANGFAYRALPIEVAEVPAEEVARYALRRPPKVAGPVRIVRMGDEEVAACGGTHLRSTAEAAPVKLLGRSRIRGGLTRVTFRAGWEALEHHGTEHAVVAELAGAFSARPEQLPERVAALREEAAAAARRGDALAARLADALAARWLAERGAPLTVALPAGDAPLLATFADALDARLAERSEGAAVLAAPDGDGVRLVATASPAAVAAGFDAAALLRAALPAVEGRGGGRPARAQGAGPRGEGIGEALERARAALGEGGADGV